MLSSLSRLFVLAVLGVFVGFASGADKQPTTKPAIPNASWAGKVEDYLKDGKLKEKLILSYVHNADRNGRSSGSTIWTIETSGEWTQTLWDMNFGIRPPRSKVVAKGKLTPEQLTALAQHLATQGFNTLPDRVGSEFTLDTWSLSVSVKFGKKTATLETMTGSLTEGRPEAGDPRANDWSRFVTLALVMQNLCQEIKPIAEPLQKADEQTKPAKVSPLKMRLIAGKGPYTLDLGGKTPKEFRKLLEEFDPFGRPGKQLPRQDVYIVIEITNTGEKPVTIRIGGDDSHLEFDLKGPGAVSVYQRLTTADWKVSHPVTIAPGQSYRHEIKLLASEPRSQHIWYMTEPGEYTLSARWSLGEPQEGEPMLCEPKEREFTDVLTAEPIKLKVVAAPQASDYLKDGKLKERIEVRSVLLSIAGNSYSYYAIEPDGSWSMGMATPRSELEELAKGKLTPEQLAELAKELARFDLASLPTHGKLVFDGRHIESGPRAHVTEIQYGSKVVVLYSGKGKSSDDEDQAIRVRYIGILAAVETLCMPPRKC
jgi:hypothetical protein